MPTRLGAGEPFHHSDVGRAVSLLQEALGILDSMDDRPDVAARLQDVIDRLTNTAAD